MAHGGGSLAKGAQQSSGESGRALWSLIELGELLEHFRLKCLESCLLEIDGDVLFGFGSF